MRVEHETCSTIYGTPVQAILDQNNLTGLAGGSGKVNIGSLILKAHRPQSSAEAKTHTLKLVQALQDRGAKIQSDGYISGCSHFALRALSLHWRVLIFRHRHFFVTHRGFP